MRCTEAQLETLSTALDAYLRAEAAAETATEAAGMVGVYRNEARAMNRLEDAAVACGMARDEPSVTAWVAARTTEWLLSAPLAA